MTRIEKVVIVMIGFLVVAVAVSTRSCIKQAEKMSDAGIKQTVEQLWYGEGGK